MQDKFHNLTIRQALAVQIFYSTRDDENLHGKTLNSNNLFEPLGVVEAVTFRETEVQKNETLEKLIAAKEYEKILQQYDKPDATFKMVVIYKDEKDELRETTLSNALKLAMSPEELPAQIIEFLLEKEEYRFLGK